MQHAAPARSGVLIGLTVLLLGLLTTASAAPAANDEQLGLSRHLKRVGALFYGAWWCPACTRQKALFGEQGAHELPYVECDRVPGDRGRCEAALIKVFPTWDLKGKERLTGVQSLEELKSWSGYNR
jgi:hypothetical protein